MGAKGERLTFLVLTPYHLDAASDNPARVVSDVSHCKCGDVIHNGLILFRLLSFPFLNNVFGFTVGAKMPKVCSPTLATRSLCSLGLVPGLNTPYGMGSDSRREGSLIQFPPP